MYFSGLRFLKNLVAKWLQIPIWTHVYEYTDILHPSD